MDVDLLSLPLKVTVGLVMWTIALLAYRVFQATFEDEVPPERKPKCPAETECESSSGEYFLKSTCTCTGVITGVVTYMSESDKYRLFHGVIGPSQMEETLHVRLTGLEKSERPSELTRIKMFETVVEMEESDTSSTTSVTSRGESVNPLCGSFTLTKHNHRDHHPYVDDKLPGTSRSQKGGSGSMMQIGAPDSQSVIQDEASPRESITEASPISIIPVDVHIPDGKILSNSGPEYDLLHQKLHRELSQFQVLKNAAPDQANDYCNVSEHYAMMRHVHDHNEAVAEMLNRSHARQKDSTISSQEIAIPEDIAPFHEPELVIPIRIPPSITPRATPMISMGLESFQTPQGPENISEQNWTSGVSQDNESTTVGDDGTASQSSRRGRNFPTIVNSADGIQPFASVRRGHELIEAPIYELLSQHMKKLPRIKIDGQNPSERPPIQNGYGQIIRKPSQNPVTDIVPDDHLSSELNTSNDHSGVPQRVDSNMNSICKDDSPICSSFVPQEKTERTRTPGPTIQQPILGDPWVELNARDRPAQLTSNRRASWSSDSRTEVGWSTTWDESPSAPSTPDSDVPPKVLEPIQKASCLSSGTISGTVTHVGDGEGFTLLHECGDGGQSESRVRVADIDAPKYPDQPFSQESLDHLNV